MKVATQCRSYPATILNATQKKELALKSIRKSKPIAHIAQHNNVSRKFVYKQKTKAIAAIDNAFNTQPNDDDKILFYLPVTTAWIKQLILSIMFNCHGTFRGIIKTIEDVLDYRVSIGTIYNVEQEALHRAQLINAQEELKDVTLAANDELFHHDKPVLAGVDVSSLYCYLLSQEQQRDGDTWAIHFWDLEKRGFNPERSIGDNGDGLRAGHKIALPHIPFDADNFHITQTLIELRRFFRNRLKSAITYRKTLEGKMEKAKQYGTPQKYARKLGQARQHEKQMRYLSHSIDTLVSWMEHDVLNKAGPDPNVRRELYDFIVEEFQKLEAIHPHRIRAVRVTLQNLRDLLLAFTDVLDEKIQIIAARFSCPLERVWEMCELQRCKHSSDTYAIRFIPLQDYFQDEFDAVEDAVLHALDTTERTSSMIENLNSRLSPYFFLRREIGNGYLDLLRFYLNHTPFLRSERAHRVGKTPAEILTGKSHPHWLEMLGFERFKRAA